MMPVYREVCAFFSPFFLLEAASAFYSDCSIRFFFQVILILTFFFFSLLVYICSGVCNVIRFYLSQFFPSYASMVFGESWPVALALKG